MSEKTVYIRGGEKVTASERLPVVPIFQKVIGLNSFKPNGALLCFYLDKNFIAHFYRNDVKEFNFKYI